MRHLAVAAPVLLLVLSLAGAPARAADPDVSIAIFEHGIYTADIERHIVEPNGIGRNELVNICHVTTTTTIPTIFKLHFGFRFRIVGDTPGLPVTLHKVVVFPTAMQPTGGPGPVTSYQHDYTYTTGGASFTGYSFDHEWERQPGPWLMQIWQGQRKLAEMMYDVIDGRGQPLPQSSNANCFPIS